jgi:hypothetical protein
MIFLWSDTSSGGIQVKAVRLTGFAEALSSIVPNQT